jgi:hypothetical protein
MAMRMNRAFIGVDLPALEGLNRSHARSSFSALVLWGARKPT